MTKKIAFIFPGQGAQYAGMGKDFYDQFSVARETFEEADHLLSRNFSKLIFEGPSQELTLTKNSQIAIYIASIAVWRTVKEQFPDLNPSVCAGLSLGEYTALTAAGKISFEECLRLVEARALYMNDACDATAGTMQVILGLDADTVEQVVGALNPPHSVWVANINCPGQVVIAGTQQGLDVAVAALKEKGAKRALPLDVSGAFHSGLMKSAQDKLEPKILEVTLETSPIELVMNVPGGYVSSLEEIRQNLIKQVTSPVRWEKGVRAMMENQIELYIEMGCGKTLLGMNKRVNVGVPTISVEKINELEELANYEPITR